MVFERVKASRKAAVFFDSLPELCLLKILAETGIILHGSQNCTGVQIVPSALYNTVEVKNYAE